MSAEEDESWKSLCAGVGAALIACQSAEKLMVFCVAHLFPDEPIQSFEMLEQIDKQIRRKKNRRKKIRCKKMLGELIGELRKRVGPVDNFDILLSDFLEHRNTLVHDFGRITGNDLSTPERRTAIKDFASRTSIEAAQLSVIFVALIDAWIEQHEWREKLFSELHPDSSRLLAEVRKTLAPHFKDVVFKKPSELSKDDSSSQRNHDA